jgi:hypothetical protein
VSLQLPPKNPDSRCKARAKTGKRCTAAATASGRCYFHTHPNKASELGRIGGRNKRPPVTENVDPLPSLDNALAVRDTVARLVADVHAGKTHLRIAVGLAPLLSLQLRAIEATSLEQRVAELEKRFAEFEHEPNRQDGPSWSDFSKPPKPPGQA